MTRPWWYGDRVPALPRRFGISVVWVGGGLLLGLLATFVQGAARARHDRLHGA